MLTTTVGELRAALAATALVQHRQPSVPVLAGVRVQSQDGSATVTGYDFEAAITRTIPAPGSTPGLDLVVEHGVVTKLLAALTKGMPKAQAARLPAAITPDDGKALISVAGYTVPTFTLPVDDFPAVPAAVPPSATVDRAAFTADLARVLVAASAEDVLAYLGSCYLKIASDGVSLAATDRYRVAAAVTPATVGASEPVSGLIPASFFGELAKLFEGEQIRVGIDTAGAPGTATLSDGLTTATTHLIDAGFPNVWARMPSSVGRTITADRSALVALTDKAAAIHTAKGEKDLPVYVVASGSQVAIAPDDATATPHIEAATTGIDDTYRIAFNPKFLRDALAHIPGDAVTLHINQPITPVLMTTSGARFDDPGAFRHLIMPIRTS